MDGWMDGKHVLVVFDFMYLQQQSMKDECLGMSTLEHTEQLTAHTSKKSSTLSFFFFFAVFLFPPQTLGKGFIRFDDDGWTECLYSPLFYITPVACPINLLFCLRPLLHDCVYKCSVEGHDPSRALQAHRPFG